MQPQTRQEKLAKLLKWNRENFHTFEERAKNARLICSQDDEYLDVMLHAVEA